MPADSPHPSGPSASVPGPSYEHDRFTVGITDDLLGPGRSWTDEPGFQDLAEAGVAGRPLALHHGQIDQAEAARLDAIIVGAADVTAAFAETNAAQLKVVARTGVGIDRVDIAACTRNGIAVTITPDAVRRPVAQAALALVLGCANRVVEKDRLVRSGRWAERRQFNGTGLAGRVLCLIGLGNIGQEFSRLAAPLDMVQIAVDPVVDATVSDKLGVRMLPLDQALAMADVVVVLAPLNDDTRHLLDARRLGLLRRGSILVNVARGPIIDELALINVIEERELRCGLDVFEKEPLDPASPLCHSERVILAPHALAWTDQLLINNARSACNAVLAVGRGAVPDHLFDGSVAGNANFLAKLAATRMEAR